MTSRDDRTRNMERLQDDLYAMQNHLLANDSNRLGTEDRDAFLRVIDTAIVVVSHARKRFWTEAESAARWGGKDAGPIFERLLEYISTSVDEPDATRLSAAVRQGHIYVRRNHRDAWADTDQP